MSYGGKRAVLKYLLAMCSGWSTVSVSAAYAVQALNLVKEHHLPHREMHRDDEGNIRLHMKWRDCKDFCLLCKAADIPVKCGSLHGVPAFLKRFSDRVGVLIGILAAAMLIWQSTTVVWAIEICGNKNIPEAEIRALLQSCGFSEGVRFADLDFELFQNNILMQTEDISWIAINMYGTTARVEVRERIAGESSKGKGITNMVAVEDGQIVEVRLKSGKSAVSVHDVVRKGELLISGIMTVREGMLRYDYADGEVIAQVIRSVVIEVPLQEEVKVYTGEENIKKSVIFLGKPINFSQKGSIDTSTYDTIIESVRLCLPGGIELPVWIRTERQQAYRMERECLTDEQAYDIAQSRFRMAVGELLKDAEILSLDSTAVLEDGVCRIVGDAVCLTNIARTVEIPIS